MCSSSSDFAIPAHVAASSSQLLLARPIIRSGDCIFFVEACTDLGQPLPFDREFFCRGIFFMLTFWRIIDWFPGVGVVAVWAGRFDWSVLDEFVLQAASYPVSPLAWLQLGGGV